MPEAGWYVDPKNARSERYWDGSSWLDRVRSATQPPTASAVPSNGPWSQSAQAAPASGLVRSLFDFGLSSFIAPQLILLAYRLLVILSSIAAVVTLAGFLLQGPNALRLVAIVFVPASYVLYLLLVRIGMELLIAVFRMADDVRALRIDDEQLQAR